MSFITRKTNKYGDVHFISFFSAVLDRIAYLDDNKFMTCYSAIMGNIIHPYFMKQLDSVPGTNVKGVLEDEKIFEEFFASQKNQKKNFIHDYNGEKKVDFVNLNMPQRVNIVTGESI